jgi:hypothetical protein
MNNIEQTKMIADRLTAQHPALWKAIQNIQREEEDKAEERTVDRATEMLKLYTSGLGYQEVDFYQLSLEFMY